MTPFSGYIYQKCKAFSAFAVIICVNFELTFSLSNFLIQSFFVKDSTEVFSSDIYFFLCERMRQISTETCVVSRSGTTHFLFQPNNRKKSKFRRCTSIAWAVSGAHLVRLDKNSFRSVGCQTAQIELFLFDTLPRRFYHLLYFHLYFILLS